MHSLDIFIQNYFSLDRTSIFTEFYYLVTILFDFSVPFILITLCVTLLVYIVRNYGCAILFLSSLIFGGVIIYLLKYFFNINRPTGSVISAFGQSFPSYHATIATIFFIMLMYIFDDYLKGLKKVLFNLFCVICILLVSFSRVYLGAHWFSDVLGGVLLGVFVCYISTTIFRKTMLQ